MSKSYPKKVTLVEMGARDGLQNEAVSVDASHKIKLIDALSNAGLKRIEAGSFVSPKWVPQMADTDIVLQGIQKTSDVRYSVLTPNMKGLELALANGAQEVAVFGAASQTFSQKNINCTIEESLTRFKPVIAEAKRHGLPVRGYVSCVLGCPYEGNIATGEVLRVTENLLDMGCYEVSLGDTIGVGTPLKTQQLIDTLVPSISVNHLAVHFHDTYGQALANILIALQNGINIIDSAVAGLGGCPYAKGASGNVATEDVLYMLNGMGIETGVDIGKIKSAGDQILQSLGRTTSSKVSAAIGAK